MAEVLGLPIRTAKQVLSQPEFIEQMTFQLVQDQKEYDSRWSRDKIDWYFAQLTWTIRQSLGGGNPGEVKDYLMEFRTAEEVVKALPSPKALGDKIISWAKMMGAKDMRGKSNADRKPDGKAGSG